MIMLIEWQNIIPGTVVCRYGEEGDRLNGHTMVGVGHGRCCFVPGTALTYLLLVRPGL